MPDEPLGALAPPGDPLGADALALKIRNWYLYAWNHPLWQRYIRQADEDEKFYVGGEFQWEEEGDRSNLDKLRAENRTVVTLNDCRTSVQVVVGLERSNRFDLKAAPEGEEDEEDARLMTWLLKYVQTRAEIGDHLSDAFKFKIMRGMSMLEIGVDWEQDPVSGKITAERLKPGKDCIWDPHWERFDLWDARFFIKWKWAYVDDLAAQFPDNADRIRAAASSLSQSFVGIAEGQSTEGPPRDAYGSVSGHPVEDLGVERQFFDRDTERALILEAWWPDWQPVWFVVDEETRQVRKFDSREVALAAAAPDPSRFRIVRKNERTMKTATILPAFYEVLEDEADTPYDNDREAYPQVLFLAERVGDEILGLIRNLKDPQRIENKRMSQIFDITGRYAALRQWFEEGSLADPRQLDTPTSTDPVRVNRGKPPPGFIVPPIAELMRVLTELAGMSQEAIRRISGVNEPLLGEQQRAQAGIAIARLQAQGQIILTEYFDNFRRARRLVGIRLAKRIQQTFTFEKTLRLTNEVGEPVLMRVNPVEARNLDRDEFRQFRERQQADGRPAVLRNPGALEFDLVISDTPVSPSARTMWFLALVEFLEKVPALLQIPRVLLKVIELSDIPDKAEIIAAIREALPQIAAGAPQNGGGGPGLPQGGATEAAVNAVMGTGGTPPAAVGPPVI